MELFKRNAEKIKKALEGLKPSELNLHFIREIKDITTTESNMPWQDMSLTLKVPHGSEIGVNIRIYKYGASIKNFKYKEGSVDYSEYFASKRFESLLKDITIRLKWGK